MKPARSFAEALQSAPTRKLRATLVRRVPLSPLIESVTVDYLFMSGRAYRFNTAGVRCERLITRLLAAAGFCSQ